MHSQATACHCRERAASRPLHASVGQAKGCVRLTHRYRLQPRRAPLTLYGFVVSTLLVVRGSAAQQRATEEVITVTGSLTPRAPLDNTVASTAIGSRAIEAPGATSAELMAQVPGVQITRTGSSSDLTTAGIRGTSSAQTSVYLAGIRLNDDLTGVADLSTLPLFMIQGIHVYRGNSPVDADRLGIGGSIMLEPKMPRQHELAAGLALGSFGHRSAQLAAGVANDGTGALIGISHERAGNEFSFTGPNGRLYDYENADATTTSAWSIGRYEIGPSLKLTTLLHAYDREKGAPGIALVPNELARTHTRRLLAAVRGSLACGRVEQPERCVVSWTSSVLRTATVITDPLREIVTSPALWLLGARYEQTARLRYELSPTLTLSAGSAFASEGINVIQLGTKELASRRLTARPAVTSNIHINGFGEVSTILSAEIHGTRGGGRTESATVAPGGRLGLYKPIVEGLAARANVGTYGRTPTLGELHGISDSVRGNDEVVPERNHTVDLGLAFAAQAADFRFDADVFAFALATSNLIAYRQTGPSAIAPYNVGSARIVGAEAMAGVKAFQHLRGQLVATVIEPRDVTPGRGETNTLLPFRSRLTTFASMELFTDVSRSVLDYIGSVARLTQRSSKYADTAGLIVIPSQYVLDVELIARFERERFVARLALNNVLDGREVDMVGAPLPGRSIYLSVMGKLQ
jgi:vitamin B12 transporter